MWTNQYGSIAQNCQHRKYKSSSSGKVKIVVCLRKPNKYKSFWGTQTQRRHEKAVLFFLTLFLLYNQHHKEINLVLGNTDEKNIEAVYR